MVKVIAKMAPIGPNTQDHNIRDTKITNSEIFNSSPMNLGFIIFSTMALMIINPAITMIASAMPDSANARKAGGIKLRTNLMLGIKLKRNCFRNTPFHQPKNNGHNTHCISTASNITLTTGAANFIPAAIMII